MKRLFWKSELSPSSPVLGVRRVIYSSQAGWVDSSWWSGCSDKIFGLEIQWFLLLFLLHDVVPAQEWSHRLVVAAVEVADTGRRQLPHVRNHLECTMAVRSAGSSQVVETTHFWLVCHNSVGLVTERLKGTPIIAKRMQKTRPQVVTGAMLP